MDRISHLPDFIVHHILSFLNTRYDPPKELVRMSVLSKTWFHLTATFPRLYFNIDNFISRESFFKYVEYTTSRFCHQNLTARRFQLNTDIVDPAELDIVNRCLELALNNGVEDLAITINYQSEGHNYRLPSTLLSVSVLKSLTIRGCDLPCSLTFDAVKFKYLVHLALREVHIGNEMITYLINSCPLLQTFNFVMCKGMNNICVYGHQNLQKVLIFYDAFAPIDRIDIDAPNLSTLGIVDFDNIGAPRMNLASCKKLIGVAFDGHPLPNSNGFTNFLSNFPFVEIMSFHTVYKGNNLNLSSHSLRALNVSSLWDLEDVELSAPNLDLFVYTCTSCMPKNRHSTHLKAYMQCYLDGSVDTLWFQKLRLFFDKKNGFRASNLYIHTTQKFTELEILKAIELPPYELEHVELELDTHEEPLAQIAFVDVVLWCCRPQTLTLISSSSLTDFEEHSDLVMFSYKRLLEQEDQGHTSIKIKSPSSLLVALPSKGKAISFIKEEVLQEEQTIKGLQFLKIF